MQRAESPRTCRRPEKETTLLVRQQYLGYTESHEAHMKNKQKRELAVCGYAAVKALEARRSEAVRRLYFTKERARQFGALCRALAARSAPYNIAEPEELESLCGSVHHQGVVAMIAFEPPQPLTQKRALALAQECRPVVLLDRIGNANNLGAIVRSAAFFGIRSIVLPLEDGQSLATTSAFRVAQGGMEYVDLYSVRSPAAFLQDMEGRMIRAAADVRGKEPVSRLGQLCAGKSCVLIIGNEEDGVSKELLRLCDHRVVIPGAALPETGVPAVESLNAAQAASVMFYECTRRREK